MIIRIAPPVSAFCVVVTACVALRAHAQAPVQLAPIDAVAIAKAEAPRGLKRTPQIDQVIADLRAGRREQANRAFGEYVAGIQRGGAVDIEALVQWVLREAYMQSTQDLREQAEKVKNLNTAKHQVREYLQELRDAAQSMARSTKPTPKSLRCRTWPRIEARPCALTKEQIDKEIVTWEAKLNELGDDAQLANVDLQNILQKQQQTQQMMSNVSKMLHDTANSVIRKIGG